MVVTGTQRQSVGFLGLTSAWVVIFLQYCLTTVNKHIQLSYKCLLLHAYVFYALYIHQWWCAMFQFSEFSQWPNIQWNLYNKTGEVLLKTHKFHHLCGTVFTKSCLFSLSWETTCLQRPQNLVVALYRLHCINSNLVKSNKNFYIGMTQICFITGLFWNWVK